MIEDEQDRLDQIAKATDVNASYIEGKQGCCCGGVVFFVLAILLSFIVGSTTAFIIAFIVGSFVAIWSGLAMGKTRRDKK